MRIDSELELSSRVDPYLLILTYSRPIRLPVASDVHGVSNVAFNSTVLPVIRLARDIQQQQRSLLPRSRKRHPLKPDMVQHMLVDCFERGKRARSKEKSER